MTDTPRKGPKNSGACYVCRRRAFPYSCSPLSVVTLVPATCGQETHPHVSTSLRLAQPHTHWPAHHRRRHTSPPTLVPRLRGTRRSFSPGGCPPDPIPRCSVDPLRDFSPPICDLVQKTRGRFGPLLRHRHFVRIPWRAGCGGLRDGARKSPAQPGKPRSYAARQATTSAAWQAASSSGLASHYPKWPNKPLPYPSGKAYTHHIL